MAKFCSNVTGRLFVLTGVIFLRFLSSQSAANKLRMGIVLIQDAVDTSVVFDYTVQSATIDLAVRHAQRDFNVEIESVPSLYQVSGCTADSLKGLNATVRALDAGVDLLLGPACTNDLLMAAKLSTVLRVPLLTGAGSLLDSTDGWPYVLRTAYNTWSQWGFFLQMCQLFRWTTVAVYYEVDSPLTDLNGQSTSITVIVTASIFLRLRSRRIYSSYTYSIQVFT